jgi:hypothetical protein
MLGQPGVTSNKRQVHLYNIHSDTMESSKCARKVYHGKEHCPHASAASRAEFVKDIRRLYLLDVRFLTQTLAEKPSTIILVYFISYDNKTFRAYVGQNEQM